MQSAEKSATKTSYHIQSARTEMAIGRDNSGRAILVGSVIPNRWRKMENCGFSRIFVLWLDFGSPFRWVRFGTRLRVYIDMWAFPPYGDQ